jgi:hypothetical protein
MQSHPDFFTVPGECFVRRVVKHFLNNVQGAIGAGVHAWALFDRFQAFQDANGAFRVGCVDLGCHDFCALMPFDIFNQDSSVDRLLFSLTRYKN